MVSPKVADPAVRVALIENAARITAEEGRDALTLRRLAAEVGTSTMAIYTHFGGMDELRRAVRREGFERLAGFLEAVGESSDPVADVIAQGLAYFENAMANPNLYRAMFLDPWKEDEEVGLETFALLVRTVERCLEAGRITDGDPTALANQLWAVSHGAVTLCSVGLMSREDAAACCAEGGRNLLLAHGDTPSAIERSFQRVAVVSGP